MRNLKLKSAQDIQDEMFRAMPAGKKLKLMSNFFSFARVLNPRAFDYGTRGVTQKDRRNSS